MKLRTQLNLSVFVILTFLAGCSRCAVTHRKGLPYAQAFPEIKPVLSKSDVALPWSNAGMTLIRKGYKYNYDNYTIINEGGAQKERWTKKRRRLPRKKSGKRGSAVDYQADPSELYVWQQLIAPDQDGRVNIEICYETEEAKSELHCTLVEAVEKWNSRLNGVSSAYFKLHNRRCALDRVTQTIAKNLHMVVVQYRKDHWGEATLGLDAKPSTDDPNYWLKLDKNVFTDPQELSAATAAAHELGHVLGLGHEHQRPDAGTFVRFTPSDLDGYDDLRRYLESGPLHWPDHAKKTGPITIADCAQYGELSFAFNEIGSRWGGDDYVPGTRDAHGANMFNVPSYFEPLGPFDRDSVMMYQSRLHGHPVIQFIMHQPNGQTTYEQIPKRQDPSIGDIMAVAQLYPL